AHSCFQTFAYVFSLEIPTTFILLFFFNDTPTTELYTLSLHNALPILTQERDFVAAGCGRPDASVGYYAMLFKILHIEEPVALLRDRKSTRLNSSHDQISYAVFCLKKKKTCRARFHR